MLRVLGAGRTLVHEKSGGLGFAGDPMCVAPHQPLTLAGSVSLSLQGPFAQQSHFKVR